MGRIFLLTKPVACGCHCVCRRCTSNVPRFAGGLSRLRQVRKIGETLLIDGGVELLKDGFHQQRKHDGRVSMNFSEATTFAGWHELPPTDSFRIRATGKTTPVDWFRANPDPITKPRNRQIESQPLVGDVKKGANLLSPVSRHAAADRHDAQSLSFSGESRILLKVQKRIKRWNSSKYVVLGNGTRPRVPRLKPPLRKPGGDVQAHFAICERRNENGHILPVRTGQNTGTLVHFV